MHQLVLCHQSPVYTVPPWGNVTPGCTYPRPPVPPFTLGQNGRTRVITGYIARVYPRVPANARMAKQDHEYTSDDNSISPQLLIYNQLKTCIFIFENAYKIAAILLAHVIQHCYTPRTQVRNHMQITSNFIVPSTFLQSLHFLRLEPIINKI